jgi:hypothetical protein
MDGAMGPNQLIHVLIVDTGGVVDRNVERKAKAQIYSIAEKVAYWF